jgi:hypothetical protein
MSRMAEVGGGNTGQPREEAGQRYTLRILTAFLRVVRASLVIHEYIYFMDSVIFTRFTERTSNTVLGLGPIFRTSCDLSAVIKKSSSEMRELSAYARTRRGGWADY